MGAQRLRGRWLRGLLAAAAILIVTAMPAAAHNHLIVGDAGVVSNTDGDGVNVRSEPSLDSSVHFVAPEGTQLQVTSGPQDAGGQSWYGVHVEGTDAWIVGDYLSTVPMNAGTQVQVVDTDGHGLRLRSGASLGSTTLTVMPEGTVLDVIGPEQTSEAGEPFVNVTYNGTDGFAHRGYLTFSDGAASATTPAVESAPDPEPEQNSTGGVSVGSNAQIVNTDGDGLNIRHGAGYGNSVVTVAAEGDVVHVMDGPVTDGDGVNWWNVDYKGHNGWAHGGYLQSTDLEVTQPGGVEGSSSPGGEADSAPAPSSTGEAIAAEAMRYLGYPYVWGGTTPSGFDCSGFIYYVVNQVTGGGFPRVLETQVNSGTHVPSDQLRAGDLVFQQNTYQWGLSHAGIYIGNGQFIHASTPTSGVIVSDLWDSYWGQRFYAARRIS